MMSTKTGKQLGLKTLLLAQSFCCSCLCFMQKKTNQIGLLVTDKFLVSIETVVLRRWERSKQKFGFIKRVDKSEITTVKDLES